jgi:quercetin dioxygenase-like cupin family protein
MNYQLPHTITNPAGERLTFRQLVQEPGGDKLLVENAVKPGHGPVMHTHYLQEEALTVVSGKIGYLIKGQQPQYAEAGQTVIFKPGVAHKFWNAGEDELRCTGYIKPANTIVFFLSSIFAAQNKTGTERPELFDAAYLVTRYTSEYDMNEMPWPVKKIIVPVVYCIGKLLGKYRHFKDAPAPVKP